MLKISALPAARRTVETDHPLSVTSVAYASDVAVIGQALDPRVNPCPECPEGVVLSTLPLGAPFVAYVCSAECGWSA